jgi:CO/xanthine dehydrogenase Mo-binding subunit
VASTFYTGVINPVTYKMPVYKFEGARVFTNKPPCGPKRGHGTPQPRFALECQLDKAAEQLGIDPADLRRRIVAEPFTKTANHLTVTTIGLGECIDKVVEASGWRDKRARYGEAARHAATKPLWQSRKRKGVGIAGSAYMTGAGTAIYWNNMPHSGVVIRADRSVRSPSSAAPPTSARARTRSWRTCRPRCWASSPRTSTSIRPTPASRPSTSGPTPHA